ncbi:MAG TPA: hypothetical protein VGE52_03560, partial [Pirellulales bacterium]
MTKSRADDFLDEESFVLEIAFDVDVRGAQENDLDLGFLVELFDDANRIRFDETVADLGAALKALEHFAGHVALEFHGVDAREFRIFLDAFGEHAVVRQQQDALVVEIEAADRENALSDFDEVFAERGATVGIADERDHALRLVKRDVDVVFFFEEELARDLDVVNADGGAIAEFRDLSVDGNLAHLNELFRFSS